MPAPAEISTLAHAGNGERGEIQDGLLQATYVLHHLKL